MISAVIVAAGKGERAGFSENKLFQPINGMPALLYSLSAFSMEEIGEILVVCSKEDKERMQRLISPYPSAEIVLGGATRGESVYNALKKVKGEMVLVHDGARPFVTREIILRCVRCVEEHGSGVCAVPSPDTAAIVSGSEIESVPNRQTVYLLQTPQGFYTKDILFAYEQAEKDGLQFTDESGVYSHYIGKPNIFEGERTNRKLTYRGDFAYAERVGFGIDTHAFCEDGDYVTLGGVKVPSSHSLIAHSDGDVLVHALMDALLSAAGLRDIGCYFPDTDDRFLNANSMELLKIILREIEKQGFAPYNVSVSVLAQTPRLSPYIEAMKENLAAALSLPLSCVAIAAGTNEKLGYVGEGKGITVFATVMLKKII